MADEKSTFTKALVAFGSTAFVAVLGWLCLSVISILGRLDKLEGDMSNWSTLAELRSRQIQLEVQLETMRRVWEYEYQRHIPTGKPAASEKPAPPDPAPPSPPALDPEQFRVEQMKKYPPKK
jgi:hypothetical protein